MIDSDFIYVNILKPLQIVFEASVFRINKSQEGAKKNNVKKWNDKPQFQNFYEKKGFKNALYTYPNVLQSLISKYFKYWRIFFEL